MHLKRLSALALALAVAAMPAVAQTKRPMTLVDVASLPRALDPQISPDGKFVSYMLQAPDWATSGYAAQIWKQPTARRSPSAARAKSGSCLPTAATPGN